MLTDTGRIGQAGHFARPSAMVEFNSGDDHAQTQAHGMEEMTALEANAKIEHAIMKSVQVKSWLPPMKIVDLLVPVVDRFALSTWKLHLTLMNLNLLILLLHVKSS